MLDAIYVGRERISGITLHDMVLVSSRVKNVTNANRQQILFIQSGSYFIFLFRAQIWNIRITFSCEIQKYIEIFLDLILHFCSVLSKVLSYWTTISYICCTLIFDNSWMMTINCVSISQKILELTLLEINTCLIGHHYLTNRCKIIKCPASKSSFYKI